jgi:hypothetical protein
LTGMGAGSAAPALAPAKAHKIKASNRVFIPEHRRKKGRAPTEKHS